METVRARHIGPCFGVRDALTATEAALDGAPDHTVVANGSIVHNEQAMDRLRARGLGVDPEGASRLAPGARLVITAHGAPPEMFAEAERRGVEVLDTTCPLVRRVQDAARALVDAGRTLVVVGHGNHPEVRGVAGWAGGAHVVTSVEDAERVPAGLDIGVAVQSTFPGAELPSILEVLDARAASIEVRDTRCPVVTLRQRSALEMLELVDVVVVVGGRASANTRALAQRCAEQRPTHHVETAGELRREWFGDARRVGITSGTSTPDWLVDQVEEACRGL